MKIDDLSRTELLSLIYHALPKTKFRDHEVFCGACADYERPSDAYLIICDTCELEFAPKREEGECVT